MTHNEIELKSFFTAASELRAALEAGNRTLADLALGEITGIWLYSSNLKLRDRCADLLEGNGWANEMARLCAA